MTTSLVIGCVCGQVHDAPVCPNCGALAINKPEMGLDDMLSAAGLLDKYRKEEERLRYAQARAYPPNGHVYTDWLGRADAHRANLRQLEAQAREVVQG